MTDRAERLRSAFGELLKRNLASTKKDIAEKMGASAPNVSSAFGGDPKVLTDRLLSRFNAAYGNIFSLEWLLSGEGEMIKPVVQQISYGDKSPNLNGKGNTVSFGCDDSRSSSMSLLPSVGLWSVPLTSLRSATLKLTALSPSSKIKNKPI